MATNLGSFDTRIQLKSDTEANWIAHPIVPLLGEIIIYNADNTHNYTRLKVGDGNTVVTSLPFIDAGTIDGHSLPAASVLTYMNKTLFPYPGSADTLYVDLATGIIYCYTPASGYTQLSNFTYQIEKTNVSNIIYWRAGLPTSLSCQSGTLKVSNGAVPALNYEQVSVVKNIVKEASE